MTFDDLRAYQGLLNEIAIIEEELKHMYYPVGSPPIVSDWIRSSTPGDPTMKAVFRIDDKREKLEKKIAELHEKAAAIEAWVMQVEDHQIAAIVRYKYLQGHSWKETDHKFYRRGDPDRCYKMVKYYLEKKA